MSERLPLDSGLRRNDGWVGKHRICSAPSVGEAIITASTLQPSSASLDRPPRIALNHPRLRAPMSSVSPRMSVAALPPVIPAQAGIQVQPLRHWHTSWTPAFALSSDGQDAIQPTTAFARRDAKAVRCIVSCAGAKSAACTSPSASIAGNTVSGPEAATSQPVRPNSTTCTRARAVPRASDRMLSERKAAGSSSRSVVTRSPDCSLRKDAQTGHPSCSTSCSDIGEITKGSQV